MDDCRGQNDGRAGEDRQDRANQTDSEQHNRQKPPEQFHAGLIVILS